MINVLYGTSGALIRVPKDTGDFLKTMGCVEVRHPEYGVCLQVPDEMITFEVDE